MDVFLFTGGLINYVKCYGRKYCMFRKIHLTLI